MAWWNDHCHRATQIDVVRISCEFGKCAGQSVQGYLSDAEMLISVLHALAGIEPEIALELLMAANFLDA